jgi:hypothetical protein
MPTPPLCPTFLQLNHENRLDRTTVSGISWIGHVGRSLAEANQLFVADRLDALPQIFNREFCFGNHA